VHFIDEEGADGGGLTREFYTLLGENLQNPELKLFEER